MTAGGATRPPQQQLGRVLKAISDPHRRQILSLLAEQDLPVGGIAARLPIGRHAVMKHLRVLRSADLLAVRPAGRARIQALNAAPLRSVEDWVARIEGLWDQSLRRLKRRVEEEAP